MIDPIGPRAPVPATPDRCAVLEAEARAALVDARGGAAGWRSTRSSATAGPTVDRPRRCSSPCSTSATTAPLDVGYLVLDVDGGVARVDQVYVTPEARELGFGDALLEAATDGGRRRRRPGARGRGAARRPRDQEPLRAGRASRPALITVSRRLD